ncbi:hypothetical protein KKH36_02925 [Patescibacteria group bacterium]|nr:hypothetical protein [Patescibacteria group bacterium]
MLNTFPDLLTFAFMAPLILRVVAGSYFIKQAWIELIKYKKRKTNAPRPLRMLSAIGGILLILGFLTQVTSLFLILIVIFNLIDRIRMKKLEENKLNIYILLLGILLSLLLSGAGFLAIDMPL